MMRRISVSAVLTTVPPAQRFVFVRNPYFHRIDGKGKQLPYIATALLSFLLMTAMAIWGFGVPALNRVGVACV